MQKNVSCVAADFLQGSDPKNSYFCLSLIDKQILVYYIKQTGSRYQLEELFSFYVKLPTRIGLITTLSLARNAQNFRPILCLGSDQGDIFVYYLDYVNPKTDKPEPLLKSKFNFFTQKLSIENTARKSPQNLLRNVKANATPSFE